MTLTLKVDENPAPQESFRAEIRPNCSMSPRNLAGIVICLVVVCLAIALTFFSMGLWLVLPFAGLEILVIGLAVGCTIRRSQDYEIILVKDDDVSVTRREGREIYKRSFHRYWTQVRLEPAATRLTPSRLRIGSHGVLVEVGRQITDQARGELAARLKQALQRK